MFNCKLHLARPWHEWLDVRWWIRRHYISVFFVSFLTLSLYKRPPPKKCEHIQACSTSPALEAARGKESFNRKAEFSLFCGTFYFYAELIVQSDIAKRLICRAQPPSLSHLNDGRIEYYCAQWHHAGSLKTVILLCKDWLGDFGKTTGRFVYKKTPNTHSRNVFHFSSRGTDSSEPKAICVNLFFSSRMQMPVWMAGTVLRQVHSSPRMCPWHLHWTMAVSVWNELGWSALWQRYANRTADSTRGKPFLM